MKTTYIIDGYNLLRRSFPDALRGATLAGAREFLQDRLAELQRDQPSCRIILVFDGQRGGATSSVQRGGVRVVFSRPPKTADDVVLELCRTLEGIEDVVVVTSDIRDVASRLRGLECRHSTSEEFALRLEAARGGRPGRPERRKGADDADDEGRPERLSDEEAEEWLRRFSLRGEGEPR